VAARSKEGVCGCSLAANVESNRAGRHEWLSVVSVVCVQVEVSAMGRYPPPEDFYRVCVYVCVCV